MLGASNDHVSSSIMCGNDRNYFQSIMLDPNSIWSTMENEMEIDDFDHLVTNTTSPFVRCRIYCPSNSTNDLFIIFHDMLLHGKNSNE